MYTKLYSARSSYNTPWEFFAFEPVSFRLFDLRYTIRVVSGAITLGLYHVILMRGGICEHGLPMLTFSALSRCQSTLLRLLEDRRKALDNHEYVGAILMDLSKAFDCLPHGLLIAKLKAYGLSEEAVKLLDSYLEDRSQQIRLGTHTSSWDKLLKGVPQGSIL